MSHIRRLSSRNADTIKAATPSCEARLFIRMKVVKTVKSLVGEFELKGRRGREGVQDGNRDLWFGLRRAAWVFGLRPCLCWTEIKAANEREIGSNFKAKKHLNTEVWGREQRVCLIDHFVLTQRTLRSLMFGNG